MPHPTPQVPGAPTLHAHLHRSQSPRAHQLHCPPSLTTTPHRRLSSTDYDCQVHIRHEVAPPPRTLEVRGGVQGGLRGGIRGGYEGEGVRGGVRGGGGDFVPTIARSLQNRLLREHRNSANAPCLHMQKQHRNPHWRGIMAPRCQPSITALASCFVHHIGANRVEPISTTLQT